MRRSTIRIIGAALLFVPLVSTCTQPRGMIASTQGQGRTLSEDRLVGFLIDGEAAKAGRG